MVTFPSNHIRAFNNQINAKNYGKVLTGKFPFAAEMMIIKATNQEIASKYYASLSWRVVLEQKSTAFKYKKETSLNPLYIF